MRPSAPTISLFALAALVAAATPAKAEDVPPGTNYIGVAPRVGVQINHEAQFVLGAEGRFGVVQITPMVRLDIRAVFDYLFQSDFTIFDTAGDAIFSFDIKNELFEPYAIAGLNVYYVSGFGASDTRLGLNLGGGAKFLPKTRMQPFAELRFSIQDGTPIILAAGFMFVVK